MTDSTLTGTTTAPDTHTPGPHPHGAGAGGAEPAGGTAAQHRASRTATRPLGPLVRRLARARRLPPWTLIVAGALAGGVLGGAYGALKAPSYTATAYVVAVPTEKSEPASALGFAQAYGRVATQLAVLGDAQVWAGVPVDTLRSSVQTSTSPDAPMVAVTATSARPGLAADMANAVSRALTLHADHTSDATHVELQQFARATEPAAPSSASPALTGLVGASAGGLLGGMLLLARPRRAPRPGEGAASLPAPAAAADSRGAL